jgi:hypothetical protein
MILIQPGLSMHLIKQALTTALLMAGLAGASQAAIISFGGAAAGDGSGLTTAVAGATVYTFNTSQKPDGYGGDGSVLSESISGMSAAPAGDRTAYLSVAYPKAAGVETFLAAANSSYNYFGLYWGSIDDYNSMAFYRNGTLVSTVTGLDVIAMGTRLGDQSAAGSNRYVNIDFGTDSFDRIDFTTTHYAFESDNHAFANTSVPEPGTLSMMGLGLLGAAAAMRHRKTTGNKLGVRVKQ